MLGVLGPFLSDTNESSAFGRQYQNLQDKYRSEARTEPNRPAKCLHHLYCVCFVLIWTLDVNDLGQICPNSLVKLCVAPSLSRRNINRSSHLPEVHNEPQRNCGQSRVLILHSFIRSLTWARDDTTRRPFRAQKRAYKTCKVCSYCLP